MPGKYILPGTIYMKTLYQIRDYHRLKEEAQAILEESPSPADGQPRGSNIGDPVVSKASKREKYLRVIGIIENARDEIPIEYRHGVWASVMYREAFPVDAARTTYSRWKSRFIYRVAEELEFI